MGKNKRKQIEIQSTIGNFEVDSNEEVSFIKWCEIALENQLIIIDSSRFYQPTTFKLFDGYKVEVNGKVKTKLREHVYSPDFCLNITDKFKTLFPKAAEKLFWKTGNDKDDFVYIDTKGSFNTNARSFSIDQKYVYAMHNIYINKICPDDLFKMTFIPESERYSPKKHQLREKYKDCKTIDQIVI